MKTFEVKTNKIEKDGNQIKIIAGAVYEICAESEEECRQIVKEEGLGEIQVIALVQEFV